MAITWLADPNATYGMEGWTALAGTVTLDSSVVHTGLRSYKFDSGAANAVCTLRKSAILADAGRRMSQYRYFPSLPTASANIIATSNSTNATTIWRLQLQTTGKFRFVGSANGADGTVNCPTGQWVRISVSYTVTSTTVNEFRAWMDSGSGPVLIATATNLTLAAVGNDQLFFGYTTAPGANIVTYASDIYVDNGNTLDDPGNVNVTAKLPASVNTNTFDTTRGTGAVNERPIGTVNGRSQAGTGAVTCNFQIETAAGGDEDISSATILGYQGWIWASGVSTDQITVNGTNTTKALTTTAAYWSQVITSSAYPPGPAAIGVNRPTSSATDCIWHEGGVIVAYIPGAAGAVIAGFDSAAEQYAPSRAYGHVAY